MLLNINNLSEKIKGVFHVGAFIGEELSLYQQLRVNNIIFFEPVKHIFNILQRNVGSAAKTYNIALGNFNGKAQINISDFEPKINYYNGASSSLLQPKKHLEAHPNIVFRQTEEVNVQRLDDFCVTEKVDVTTYNMMNIDVQGYELEVLKGSLNTLQHIKYIITEVNRDQTYENCAQIEEIDEFLSQYNLIRKETCWAGGIWGDALYVRQN